MQLPVLETLCCGVLTLAAHGSRRSSRQALLPGVATGDVVLTPALREVGRRLERGARRRRTPTARSPAARSGSSYAADAARLLVTATQGDQPVVALVDVSDPGVTLLESGSSSGLTTAHRRPRRRLRRAARRRASGAHRTLAERYVVGLCLTAAGVVAGARDLTADYIKGRTQFGRSLAEFQAVAMQIADVYIASRTLDLAAENAAWRVAARAGRDRRPRGGGVLGVHRGARPRCAPATTCTAAWAST